MATQQLTVTLERVSGATEDVTASASYESSNEGVATVDSGGLVTAVAVGDCTVSISHEGLNASCDVSVIDEAQALSVQPSSTEIGLG